MRMADGGRIERIFVYNRGMATIYTFNCFYCSTEFQRNARQVASSKIHKSKQTFCSRKCVTLFNTKLAEIYCKHCEKRFKPRQSSCSTFCSQSCSATYNNLHKTYGTRRSKLEEYLEPILREKHPDLICNSKQIIGSELDFYFPSLNIAIELNGIFHYKPIFGVDKYNKIVAMDLIKIQKCKELNIHLFVIDTYNNPKSDIDYLLQIQNILSM